MKISLSRGILKGLPFGCSSDNMEFLDLVLAELGKVTLPDCPDMLLAPVHKKEMDQ